MTIGAKRILNRIRGRAFSSAFFAWAEEVARTATARRAAAAAEEERSIRRATLLRRILGKLRRSRIADGLRQWHSFLVCANQVREIQRRALSTMSALARGKKHRMMHLAW